MLTLERTNQFKRDYKREKSGQHSDIDGELMEVLDLLQAGKRLPASRNDHPLKGQFKGYRDCHLKPDLVLIYKKSKTTIKLARLGSHSELFG
ncbi:MAG: type II toxin-antitoxin system YafQ family toxin [Phenylobacterium sp.]|jgi:mRNA interferase YafQ|nr:type II toxin-antitoxin system YafQ family toxin [Phenylobacterium sp.]